MYQSTHPLTYFFLDLDIFQSTTVLLIFSSDDVALLSGADCINEELKSTAVTPEEEGGIFDAQSCVNRCDENGPYSGYITEATVTSSNKTVYILQCDCYEGCVDRKSCCLDYRSVCVFGKSIC